MVFEGISKWDGSALIEKDAHSGGDLSTPRRMFQHGANLIQRDSGEPLHELASLSAVFEVLEERSYRNSSAAEYPAAAQETWPPFDSGAR